MNHSPHFRQQLVNLLVKRQSHMTFEDAVAGFPDGEMNTRPPELDYTFWHILEHLRICQEDILDYIRNPEYESRPFPDGYWPDKEAVTDAAGWQTTIDQFLADRQALVDIINDPAADLLAKIPHGWEDDHSILREILVVADHNAYHIGEFAILRQTLNLW